MSEEIMSAIRMLYAELQQRKEEADKTVSIFTDDWHGYREYHRAIGRALGLEEARKLPLTDRLLVELMPAPMVLTSADNENERNRDLARAKILRQLTR